jgi:hypothetical protein
LLLTPLQLMEPGQSSEVSQRREQYPAFMQIWLWQSLAREHDPPTSLNESCAQAEFVDTVDDAVLPIMQMLKPLEFSMHFQPDGQLDALLQRLVHTSE